MPSLGPISYFLPDPFFTRGRTSAHGLAFMAQRGVRARLEMGSQRTDILNALIAARQAGKAQAQELISEAVMILYIRISLGAVPNVLTDLSMQDRGITLNRECNGRNFASCTDQ